jgi:hypothetical protein
MNYELISDAEYDALPDDDEQCFVQYEAICRASMNRMIDENSNSGFDEAVRSQYMHCVSAVAEACGINGLSVPQYPSSQFYDAFNRFSLTAQGEVARIRVKGRGFRHPYSVQLTQNTRTKIEHHVGRIREVVRLSDLSDVKKSALSAKLDDFVSELDNTRFGFGKAMAVLSFVLVGLASATTIAAEGPAAVNNIMKLISIDKESEDLAKRRLAPPPKTLPAPRKRIAARAAPSWDAPRGGDLDDEIPF